jgi:hypothetical protein
MGFTSGLPRSRIQRIAPLILYFGRIGISRPVEQVCSLTGEGLE